MADAAHPVLTLAEFAETYGLTIRQARGVIERRELPYRKIGNRIFITRTDAAAWWDTHRIECKS